MLSSLTAQNVYISNKPIGNVVDSLPYGDFGTHDPSI